MKHTSLDVFSALQLTTVFNAKAGIILTLLQICARLAISPDAKYAYKPVPSLVSGATQDST